MSQLALNLQDVHYAYKTNWLLQRVSCIKNLNLQIPRGESFGFLGHNGAGKTTTIKCILNLIQPQKGSIQIFGRESHNSEARASVGYLPEQPYFYDYLTVFEIMDMYATLAGIPAHEKRARIKNTLARVGLASRMSSKTRTLSKGLIQKLAMAQAIVAHPKLLILDEPFSGLDPVGRKEFADLIQELKDDGTTIFMSSHILSDVEHLCSRVSIMINGQIKGVYSLYEISTIMHGHHELIIKSNDKNLIAELPQSDGKSNFFLD